MSALSRLRSHDDTTPWKGAYAPYDLVKELFIALGRGHPTCDPVDRPVLLAR